MALDFRPPTDLINAYLNRPSPGQIASEGINQALQTYAQQKAQEQQLALAQEAKDVEMAKGLASGGQDFVQNLAQIQAQRAQPQSPSLIEKFNTWITGSKTGIDPNTRQPIPAQPSPAPAAVPTSPAPSGVPVSQGFLTPQGGIDQAAIDAYKKQHGSEGLKTLETQLSLNDKLQTGAEKSAENAPKSFDYANAFAKSAGAPDAAKPFIEIAQKEGRSTLTKREMDDMKNSINVSAQRGRGEYFSTMATVREQGLRDSLIKEARTSLDPYFQSGAGKQQAERLNRIGRADALVQQMQTQAGGGDTRQMRELATSLASVLTGGNVVAEQQIEELIPQTYKGKLNVFLEKLTNNPTGLDQQKFINRFADTLNREKTTIQKQARIVAERTAPTLRVLKSQFPEDYNAVVGQYLQNSPEIMGSTVPAQPPPDSGLVHLSTKELMDLRKKMTAHQSNGN